MRGVGAATAVVLALCVSTPALAGNAQDGDNAARSTQGGTSASGDAIAGPSLGLTHQGDVRIEMTNRAGPGRERDSDVRVIPGGVSVSNEQGPTDVATGDAEGGSEATIFVGLGVQDSADVLADVWGDVL